MVPKNDDASASTQPTTADDSSDMLSKLPTDVLVSILEKLSLHDAIRAGVLSRRWRHLPGQLSRLVLDIDDYFCGGDDDDDEYYDEDDPTEDLLDKKPVDDDGHTSSTDDDALSAASDKMLDVATALLASRDTCLPTLAMSFFLRHNYMSLGRLLDDAMAGGKVHAAELTVSTTSRIGIKVFRALAGYGRRFKALFDGCPAAFAGLTRLTMENMMVREAVLDDILTTCTKLEFLSLQSWDPGRRTTQWRVRHDRLADLRITFCVFGEVHLVWLPRLERFAYRYNEFHTHEPLSFGHVPRLTTLTVSNNHHVVNTVKLSKIFANTAVKDLRLNFSGKDVSRSSTVRKRS
ncbi:hypothetical protein QOZ80_8AG0615000 [Eleusine coracana subsp. coracana]|nr:hypothetical protein QOZ80_8AG0615000 [Eleusine coracana subsp. coracana]